MHRYKIRISIYLILCQCARKCRIAKSVSEDFSRRVDRPRPLSLQPARPTQEMVFFTCDRVGADRPRRHRCRGGGSRWADGRARGPGTSSVGFSERRIARPIAVTPAFRSFSAADSDLRTPKFVRMRGKDEKKGKEGHGGIFLTRNLEKRFGSCFTSVS